MIYSISEHFYIAFIHRQIEVSKPKNNAIDEKNLSATALSLALKVD
jgi:hypothetical protein